MLRNWLKSWHWNWRKRAVRHTIDEISDLLFNATSQEDYEARRARARRLHEATWPSNATVEARRAAQRAAKNGR